MEKTDERQSEHIVEFLKKKNSIKREYDIEEEKKKEKEKEKEQTVKRKRIHEFS